MKTLGLLTACLALIALMSMVASAQFDPRVPTTALLKVTLIEQTPDPVQPGDIVELSIKFENNGTRIITGLQAELGLEYPFSLIPGEASVNSIGSLGPINSFDFRTVVKFRARVADDAPSGTSEFSVRYTSDNPSGVKHDLPVSIRTKEPVINIPLVVLDPPEIAPGKSSTVSIVLQNNARSLLRDIRLVLDLPANFATIGSASTKIINRLAAGENATATFVLAVDSDTVPAVHKIPYTLDYQDETENTFTRNGTIGIPVNAIPVFSLNLEDQEVYTKGANGKVVLSVSNIGPSNMKFTLLELIDTGEYEVISAPRVYLGNLEPDDFETAEFDIHVIEAEGALHLVVQVAYKDDFNTEFSQQNSVVMKIYSGSEARSLGLVPKGGNIMISFIRNIGLPLLLLVVLAHLLIDLRKHRLAKYQRLLWALVIISIIGAPAYYWLVMRKRTRH